MAIQADGYLPEPCVANFAKMAGASKGNESDYITGLSASDKQRYLEKTENIGDPYMYVLGKDFLPPVGSMH